MVRKNGRGFCLFAVVVLCGGCGVWVGSGGDGPFGEKEKVVSPSRDMSLVEARREAIGLELELHALLSAEFGVGQWSPLTANHQVATWSVSRNCREGYFSEAWGLATASGIGDERWPEAVKRMSLFLGSRGFVDGHMWEPKKSYYIVSYVNKETGVEVEVRSGKRTLVTVESGCAKGTYAFDGWPQGTEAVPVELRGPGRGRIGHDKDVWPKETPEPRDKSAALSATNSPTQSSSM